MSGDFREQGLFHKHGTIWRTIFDFGFCLLIECGIGVNRLFKEVSPPASQYCIFHFLMGLGGMDLERPDVFLS